jgi:putative ABC transport system permease protein
VHKIFQREKSRVVGVVKDFHFSSLKQKVEPAALDMDPATGLAYAVVRISAVNMAETIAYLREKWGEIQLLRRSGKGRP